MDLQGTRFEFCVEVIAKAAQLGFRFAEVGVEYFPRTKSQGKKIRMFDGIGVLSTLWKWRCWVPTATQSKSRDSVSRSSSLADPSQKSHTLTVNRNVQEGT